MLAHQHHRESGVDSGRLYLLNLCSHLGLNLFSQGGAVNPLSHDSLCLGFVKELPVHFAAGSQARRRGASNKASGPGGLQQKCEFISVRALGHFVAATRLKIPS